MLSFRTDKVTANSFVYGNLEIMAWLHGLLTDVTADTLCESVTRLPESPLTKTIEGVRRIGSMIIVAVNAVTQHCDSAMKISRTDVSPLFHRYFFVHRGTISSTNSGQRVIFGVIGSCSTLTIRRQGSD
jgi:hypothetical protein